MTTLQLAKTRQLAKIRQLGEALLGAGHLLLEEQASVLGLARSTTWAILNARHKHSGLSGAVIRQILDQPDLPLPVRIQIAEYINEKCAGIYGHTPMQVRRFVAALSREGQRRPRKHSRGWHIYRRRFRSGRNAQATTALREKRELEGQLQSFGHRVPNTK